VSVFEPNSYQAKMVEDMRAHDGEVTQGPLAGHPLLIMTSIGAKSALPRSAILTYSRDGDDYLVAGSAAGAPTDPAWVANVRANPAVTIEAGNRTFDATAMVLEGAERDRFWARHAETLPWFAEYPKKSGRVIPMIRLTPASSNSSPGA
jgi:deazaflavin-dependent oxidoreductase (nitroreductase family)